MKLSSGRAPNVRAHVRALAAVLILFGAQSASRAQAAKKPPATDAPAQTQAGGSAAAQTQTQQPLSQRERRAQAYAELLEGERYYQVIQSGRGTMETLRLAQEAFRQAAELDPTLAEAHTALAEIYLNLNDLQKSEQEGLTAVRIDHDNFGAHRLLARVYTFNSRLAEGNVERATADKAVAELREVIRIRPTDAEGWALLAEFYAAEGKDKEAIEALQRWATLPPSVEGRFYQLVSHGRDLTPGAANARLGELLLRAGRKGEAIAAIRRAISIEPDNAAYLQLLGDALETGGGVDAGVIEELKRIASQQPLNVSAVLTLARSQARAGQVDDAAKMLRDAIAAVKPGADEDKFNLQVQLEQIYENASRYDDAVDVYEDLLKQRNVADSPLANERDRQFAVIVLAGIAGLRQQAGKTEEALAAFDRMRQLLPSTDPTAEIQKAEFLRSNGKRAEALESVRAARQRFPDEVRLLRVEATTLAELGRIEEALALVRPRLSGGSDDFDEYIFMTGLLITAKRGSEAVEAANRALALTNDPARREGALIMLSSAQERAGDMKGSEATLRQVLDKDPDNATALNNLGYFLADRGERLDEARSMIERAVKAEPSNPFFLDSLGWVNFKLGKLEEAERYLSDAARRNPTSANVQEHMGDLFQKLGQKEKAQTFWRKALSLTSDSTDTGRIKAKLEGAANK